MEKTLTDLITDLRWLSREKTQERRNRERLESWKAGRVMPILFRVQ